MNKFSQSNTVETNHHQTVEQFAAHLNVHPESARRWLRTRRLKGIKVGSQWRIPTSELTRIGTEGGL